MVNNGDVVWVVFSWFSGKPEFEMVCQDQSTAWTESMIAMAAYWAVDRSGEFDPHTHMSSSYMQGTTYVWVTGFPDSLYSYEAVTVR